MNQPQDIRNGENSHKSALHNAVGNSAWATWIITRGLPLSAWTFFLIAVLFSTSVEVRRILQEGPTVQSLLVLARTGLMAAFITLVSSAYLTRMHVTEKAQGFFQRSFPSFVFLASIAGMGLLQSRPGSPVFYSVAAGLFLGPLGLCLSIWSVWHLRNSFSILAEARRTVASGPYRYIRHPLYLGEALTMLGLCLLIGTSTALIFWGAITGLQLVRARIEETKLARTLSDYAAYRISTPFILPALVTRWR